jgi:L-fuculose-phosphate aldolase
MKSEQELREEMVEAGRLLWERDLVGATEGNLSARLGPHMLLCTPTGFRKGRLRPSDLLLIDENGVPIRHGSPSSEIKLHLRIYHRRPDCAAVVHAHPPVATGFALAGQTIPDDLLPEAGLVLGRVALAPFGLTGTEEVADAIDPLILHHKTLLLANHGAVTLGVSPMDAYNRMETLERIARVILYARSLGEPQRLDPDVMSRISPLMTGGLE